MKGILKWPLIIAVVLIVARIVAERMGASDSVTNLMSVVVFHVLIAPIYFAIRIARSDEARPYRTHFKLTALFALLARLMVAPTYYLAYMLDWGEIPRFTVEGGGVVGADSMLQVILTPIVLTIVWTLASVIVGGLLGTLIIAIGRRMAPAR